VSSTEAPFGWPLGWPTETFPMKVKSGELATSSNFSWQFCVAHVSNSAMQKRRCETAVHLVRTFTSGWSGATPNLTSPNGTGRASYMSTLAPCILDMTRYAV